MFLWIFIRCEPTMCLFMCLCVFVVMRMWWAIWAINTESEPKTYLLRLLTCKRSSSSLYTTGKAERAHGNGLVLKNWKHKTNLAYKCGIHNIYSSIFWLDTSSNHQYKIYFVVPNVSYTTYCNLHYKLRYKLYLILMTTASNK